MTKFARLAWRNLRRNVRRSIITMLALVAGMALALTAEGVANGFLELTVGDVVEGNVGALQVHRAGYLENLEGAPLALSMAYTEALVAAIEAVPGVTGVTGRIQFVGLINNGVAQTLFSGRALDLHTEYATLPLSSRHVAAAGRRLAPSDVDAALVGAQLADSFQALTAEEKRRSGKLRPDEAAAGSLLTLDATSPKGQANSLSVRVVGKWVGGNAYESKRLVTMPLALGQELLNMRGQVTELAVAIADLGRLDQVVAALRQRLGPDYDVQPWTELQPFVRDVMHRLAVVEAIVEVIFMITVLVGIINTMMMSVFERVQEIGTMLALGAVRRHIRLVFLLEAGILGAVGAALGCAVAHGMTLWLHRHGVVLPGSIDIIRPFLTLRFSAGAIAVAVACTVLASAYPAHKAANLNPADALRAR